MYAGLIKWDMYRAIIMVLMYEGGGMASSRKTRQEKHVCTYTLVGVMSSTDTDTGASMMTDTKRGGGEKETGTGRAAVIDAMLKRKMCL